MYTTFPAGPLEPCEVKIDLKIKPTTHTNKQQGQISYAHFKQGKRAKWFFSPKLIFL